MNEAVGIARHTERANFYVEPEGEREQGAGLMAWAAAKYASFVQGQKQRQR